MNSDLHAVFVRLLQVLLLLAIKHLVPRKELVKRLFVFLDMQFDAAAGGALAGTRRIGYRRRLGHAIARVHMPRLGTTCLRSCIETLLASYRLFLLRLSRSALRSEQV